MSRIEDVLFSRYPKIFADSSLRIMCGDGWFDLLDSLCRELQSATDENNAPQVVAVVVKEELGWLTFSCRGPNAAQRDMIGRAMDRSGHICEQCGQPGRRLKHHVLFTRCANHAPAGAQPATPSVQ